MKLSRLTTGLGIVAGLGWLLLSVRALSGQEAEGATLLRTALFLAAAVCCGVTLALRGR